MMNRLFLALPAMLDDYDALQKDFSGVISGRWIPSDNLHMTLSFFGKRFEKEILIESLEDFKIEIKPSEIRGLGYFKKSRILYATVENPDLEAVYRSVNMFFDMPVKENFLPHVTLMRIKKVVDAKVFYHQLHAYREHYLGSLGSKAELMQSELHPDGARYALIKRFHG